MSFVEHLASYFVDFGEAFTVGTTTATGIVDMPTRPTFDAVVREVSVTVPLAAVPGAGQGQAAVVRGVSYTVRSVEDDGTGVGILVLTKP